MTIDNDRTLAQSGEAYNSGSAFYLTKKNSGSMRRITSATSLENNIKSMVDHVKKTGNTPTYSKVQMSNKFAKKRASTAIRRNNHFQN